MAFPPKKTSKFGKPAKPLMLDNPEDEAIGAPAGEPDGDESYIDDVMGADIMGLAGDEDAMGNPLEELFAQAGIPITPEKMSRIQAILDEPEKGPQKAPGMGAKGAGAPADMKENENVMF